MCLENLTYVPDIVSLLHSIPILYYNYHASVRIWNYSEIYIVLVYNIIMSCSKREIGIRTCFKIFECIYTMYIMNIIVCHSAVFSGLEDELTFSSSTLHILVFKAHFLVKSLCSLYTLYSLFNKVNTHCLHPYLQ